MAFMNDQNTKPENYEILAAILEEDTLWFSSVATAVAYPNNASETLNRPTGFDSWHAQAVEEEGANITVLRDISDSHQQMIMEGTAILEGLSMEQKPSEEAFKSFVDCFHLYSKRMRQYELGSALEGGGLDPETGLRLIKMLSDDMKRELERLERQGTQFCLAMTRIDEFEERGANPDFVALVTSHIKQTMRPFDDAYYAGDGYFVLSLKQTDLIGAEAGINRLSMNVRKDNDSITLTTCLVEPSVGDEADDLMKKMRQDLDDNKEARNVVLRFIEVSDIERYVSTLNG